MNGNFVHKPTLRSTAPASCAMQGIDVWAGGYRPISGRTTG